MSESTTEASSRVVDITNAFKDAQKEASRETASQIKTLVDDATKQKAVSEEIEKKINQSLATTLRLK